MRRNWFHTRRMLANIEAAFRRMGVIVEDEDAGEVEEDIAEDDEMTVTYFLH